MTFSIHKGSGGQLSGWFWSGRGGYSTMPALAEEEKGEGVIIMKSAEHRPAPLLAKLGDFNRSLRVRPVRYMSREWWAVEAADTWPGMVMDLRRLGFEAVAFEDEVLVRETSMMYEPQMEGPNAASGLKPFPVVVPTIKVRPESYLSGNSDPDGYEDYDEYYNDVDVEDEVEDDRNVWNLKHLDW